jgi:hypothetical protein
MLRLLSRIFSLAACGALVLGAGSASALSFAYNASPGSVMAQDNTVAGGACTFATCNVPVTGTILIDDDGIGNVTITNLSLSHNGYEVGPAGLISVVIDRDFINLGQVPVLGSGTTLNGVTTFGVASVYQYGSTTCTPIVFPCVLAGLPTGVSPLATPIPINLGNWAFDAFGNLSAVIQYTNQAGAIEQLTLGASPTPVPEPSTIALVAAGLVGLAIRRRSSI